VSVGSSPGATSGGRASQPEGGRDPVRERIIDAALELFVRQGYDATTVAQIAAKAGVTSADFTRHFPSAEAVLIAVAEDMARTTAGELRNVAKGADPVRALLQAGTLALAAIAEGRSELALDRVLAMARVVTTTRNLHRKVSTARKRVLTRPLAHWMGVDPKDRRLRHALTMWSAVAASAYVGALSMPDPYEAQRDTKIHQRMLAGMLQSFGEVMGDDVDHGE
jgi:AcrR family transcriptional regulator